MTSIYLIGSLRNPEIPNIGNYLRSLGFDIFDDWFAAGPIADDSWQQYETSRGHNHREALKGYAANHIFAFDKHHLDRCDAAILALPAGKSGHLELGYAIGQGKPGYVLYDKEPERWDQMYQFASGIYYTKEELGKDLYEEKQARKPYLYLAGPMRGYKDFNFPAFKKAAKKLRKKGWIVFNPAERDEEKHGEVFQSDKGDLKDIKVKGFSLRDALRADTDFICMKAVAIAMLPGWEYSKGASAEHALAKALGHKIIYL